LLKSLTHHIASSLEQGASVSGTEIVCRSLTMQVYSPQRFVRINVADSGGDLLIQKDTLDLGPPASDRADDPVLIELRVQQIACDVRHRGRKSPISIVIDHGGESHPAKGALVHKSQFPTLARERDPHA